MQNKTNKSQFFPFIFSGKRCLDDFLFKLLRHSKFLGEPLHLLRLRGQLQARVEVFNLETVLLTIETYLRSSWSPNQQLASTPGPKDIVKLTRGCAKGVQSGHWNPHRLFQITFDTSARAWCCSGVSELCEEDGDPPGKYPILWNDSLKCIFCVKFLPKMYLFSIRQTIYQYLTNDFRNFLFANHLHSWLSGQTLKQEFSGYSISWLFSQLLIFQSVNWLPNLKIT